MYFLSNKPIDFFFMWNFCLSELRTAEKEFIETMCYWAGMKYTIVIELETCSRQSLVMLTG